MPLKARGIWIPVIMGHRVQWEGYEIPPRPQLPTVDTDSFASDSENGQT